MQTVSSLMKHFRKIIPIAAAAIPVTCGVFAMFFNPVTVIAAFVLMMAAACLAAGWLLFHIAVSRKSGKSFIFSAIYSAEVNSNTKANARRKEQHELWKKQTTMEEISIKSNDNLNLSATVVRNSPDSHRWVVVCHGYAQVGQEQIMYITQTFHEMGYWVLMPDARGHGKSGGDYLGLGWPDRLDLLRWIHEIGARDKAARIALYGISMGAATVTMAVGEPLPLTVKAIIADSGYTSAMKECAYQMKRLFRLPPFPILHIASFITHLRAGYWLGEASALKQIAKSKTPVLLIHGSDDAAIPPSMLEELYNAAAGPKEKMLVEGAGHGQTPLVDRMRYWQTISDFLTKAWDGDV
jgi:fermentation-respiration switch protein FrsA (DUF1100 family)